MTSDRHELAALKVVLAAAVVVLVALLFVACRDAPSPSVPEEGGLPAEYLGRWYFGGTSGGIEGREVAAADGSWIVITAGNTIEHYSAEGHVDATETFEPTRGRSIFSGEDEWILGGPDSVERVIQVHPEGVLTISENVYDGFGSTYRRSR